ncbi:MAG TPA: phosphotransferase [Acidimicrobiales bacterium]|nr:phosphotransferase [Acidimicrobiales bacterium]
MPGERDDTPFNSALQRMFTRDRLDDLPEHLREIHGTDVTSVEVLDVGVIRVERADGPAWVARVFSAQRPAKATAGDAAVLRYLAGRDYPAERLAAKKPVSTLHGQQVLVTQFVPPLKRPLEPDVYEILGRLLGRLHALSLPTGAAARPAGSLHHFAEGGRRNELDEAARWLDELEERVAPGDCGRLDQLREAIAGADDGAGLPESLIHPDPVPKNMVRVVDGYALVDWTGAGIGPRVASLEYLLGSPAAAGRVMAGYAEHVTLTDEEWERMPAVSAGRRFVGLSFRLCLAPQKAKTFVGRISSERRHANAIVDAARAGVASA